MSVTYSPTPAQDVLSATRGKELWLIDDRNKSPMAMLQATPKGHRLASDVVVRLGEVAAIAGLSAEAMRNADYLASVALQAELSYAASILASVNRSDLPLTVRQELANGAQDLHDNLHRELLAIFVGAVGAQGALATQSFDTDRPLTLGDLLQ